MVDSSSKTHASRPRRTKMRGYKSITLLVLAALGGANAQTKYDPRTQVCALRFHSSTVVGNTLYIDGGELLGKAMFVNGTDKLLDDEAVIRWQNEHMWKLDLSKTFQTSRPPWDIEYKPESHDEHYNGAQAAIYNLNDGKYTTIGGWFGIYYGPDTIAYGLPIIRDKKFYKLPSPRVFTYDTKTKSWSNTLFASNIKRVSDAAYATSLRSQVGYAVGGVLVNEQQDLGPNSLPSPTTVDWSRLLTIYNIRNDTWTVDTLPREIDFVSNGQLHSLDRVGVDGVLIFMGGSQKTDTNAVQMREYDKIWAYDVDSKVWSLQKAVGDIPPKRSRTCSVMVPAPDLSSYQIYLFSGSVLNGTVETRVLDLHVLSIPSFRWTKIKIDGTGYPDKLGLADHSCTVHNSRQLIIVPGERNDSTTAGKFMHKCDGSLGIRVFDTYEWKFTDSFDPSKVENRVPEPIVKLIGGNYTGSANVNKPESGWDEKALELAFSKRNSENKFNNGTTPDPAKETNVPTDGGNGEDSGNEKKKSSIGAIVGGVVGGIAVIALIVGLIFCVRRKNTKKVVPQAQAQELSGYGQAPAEVSGQTPYWAQQAAVGQQGGTYQTPYYDPPPANYGYAAPQELGGHGIASAPQELGGSGYYAPPKPGDERTLRGGLLAPGGVPAPSNSNPSSPSGSFVQPVSPLDHGHHGHRS